MINLIDLEAVAATELLKRPDQIPHGPGVYGLYFDQTSSLLERSGFRSFDEAEPHVSDGHQLLYVGASQTNLRGRILAHLKGDTRTSSLRMTLGVILVDDLELDPVADKQRSYFSFGDGEARLSNWIAENTRVAFFPSPNPYTDERRLLHSMVLPLNLSERMRHPYSKHLLTLRSYYAGRPDLERKRLPLIRLGATFETVRRRS